MVECKFKKGDKVKVTGFYENHFKYGGIVNDYLIDSKKVYYFVKPIRKFLFFFEVSDYARTGKLFEYIHESYLELWRVNKK